MTNLFKGEDGINRCTWCRSSQEYIAYHDQEWGFPVKDDFKLFEKVSLEGFQAGLSWRTILEKRIHFREVFKGFDFNLISNFTEANVDSLLQDSRIIRHRGKIEATINNAQKAQEMVKQEGSLASFFWRYEPSKQPLDKRSTSPESIALSKELKRRGWKFVGPTTAYAFMQAMGLVNDHAEGCYFRELVVKSRNDFTVPE
ncbi:DNA-3-methyladenine glycosylase I [uncultured Pseudoteredinibacter sp.]|uniref:DNA-3-methyladenine glycosylase I n=1 Tax=uncultured Pseudoteredinibacter sp. TaxID=1641701 RepID=UPI002618A8A7|nr:DNA-3-methyladenine glycosylase I [uncultured Pseudoteredinibacter sp.]